MKRPLLQFLGEDSQIKLYMNLNLHHDLVNCSLWKISMILEIGELMSLIRAQMIV